MILAYPAGVTIHEWTRCSGAVRWRRSGSGRATSGGRTRTDVLPAFVAEMDFDLAAPIVEAATAALAAGDCGYGHKGELGEAFAAFAAKRLRWSPDPARVYAIPDVMTAIAEVIQAVTPPGSGIVINPRSTSRSSTGSGSPGGASSRRRCGGRKTAGTTWIPRHSTGPSRTATSAPTCSAARTTPPAGSGRGSSCSPRPTSARAAARSCWSTRSTRRWCWPARSRCRSCP